MHEKICCNNFVEATVKKEITRVFYVEASLKKSPLPMMYIYSSFSPFLLSPLVEWYMNDIDKS